MVASAVSHPERIVLVVEDEDAVRRLTARILTEAGFSVLEARDGAEALGMLATLGPNVVWLVVSDIVMPRVTGDDLAEIVAQRWPSVQVLLLSALASPRGDFPVSFLQKPYTPDSLVAAARALLPSLKASVG